MITNEYLSLLQGLAENAISVFGSLIPGTFSKPNEKAEILLNEMRSELRRGNPKFLFALLFGTTFAIENRLLMFESINHVDSLGMEDNESFTVFTLSLKTLGDSILELVVMVTDEDPSVLDSIPAISEKISDDLQPHGEDVFFSTMIVCCKRILSDYREYLLPKNDNLDQSIENEKTDETLPEISTEETAPLESESRESATGSSITNSKNDKSNTHTLRTFVFLFLFFGGAYGATKNETILIAWGIGMLFLGLWAIFSPD